MVERGYRGGVSLSLCGSSVKGNWREGSLARDSEGYVKMALEMGISPYWPHLGNLEEGSCTRDFKKWMKGAL